MQMSEEGNKVRKHKIGESNIGALVAKPLKNKRKIKTNQYSLCGGCCGGVDLFHISLHRALVLQRHSLLCLNDALRGSSC